MEEYLPAIIVGLTTLLLIALVVLDTLLSGLDDTYAARDVVMIMALTSFITTCALSLCAIGLWYVWNTRPLPPADAMEHRPAKGEISAIQSRGRSGCRFIETMYTRSGKESQGETLGVRPDASNGPDHPETLIVRLCDIETEPGVECRR